MIRFAILYFFMFIVFLLLIAGPAVLSRFVSTLPSIPMDLMQPTGQNNNDTSASNTGSVRNGQGGAEATGAADTAAATSGGFRF